MAPVTDYYSPSNIYAVAPFLPFPPKWLVLGGPADAREAQTAADLWPGIDVVGVEPNPEAVEWQRTVGGWREEWPLLDCALTDESTGSVLMAFEPGGLRNASVAPDLVRTKPGAIKVLVGTTTLDVVEAVYGPFEDAVVWLDVEGSELRALRGASKLLASGRVLALNVEMLSHVPGMMDELPALLAANGYQAVAEWNYSDTCRDRVFLRADLAERSPLHGKIGEYRRSPDEPLLRLLP